ncbi:MAG: hypothetical protein J6M60_03005 [Clostridia bacterium]|nr:hypothetical protein [Clostridia bacterium]
MEEVTLKEACERVRQRMKNDDKFMKEYEFVKEFLKTVFKVENVDEEFYEIKADDEVLEFAKGLLKEDIKIDRIEIIPDKVVLIRADANYAVDEFYSKRDHEQYISTSIKAFTGYGTDISL